jgi:hypothetical protein
MGLVLGYHLVGAQRRQYPKFLQRPRPKKPILKSKSVQTPYDAMLCDKSESLLSSIHSNGVDPPKSLSILGTMLLWEHIF